MNSMLLSQSGLLTTLGIIGIVIIVIVAAICALSAVATIWKWVLVHRYTKYNKQEVAAGLTGAQVAEKMLEGLGITDVKVEKLGFWKSLFLGNNYSPKKKAVRLRGNIYDKASLTAVAIATQKVAIAQRHHDGDKKIMTRAVLMKCGYFAPFALLPLIVVGLLLDYFLTHGFGWISIVFTVFAFAYFIFSIVVAALNIKVEKRACNTAMELMKKTNLLTEKELDDAERLYRTYLTDYWIEFVYNLVYFLWAIIKLVFSVFSRKTKGA